MAKSYLNKPQSALNHCRRGICKNAMRSTVAGVKDRIEKKKVNNLMKKGPDTGALN